VQPTEQPENPRAAHVDAVVVGAGFAGLYMLHKLRELGLSARVIEKGSDVGGTWYWNRYPGARCDAASLLYSYSFSPELEQEWTWSEKFAAQPEILSYIRHVADRFDLRRDIWFDTTVDSAHFDEAHDRWTVTTNRGDHVVAAYCIMATGCLSVGRIPDIAGLPDTKLPVYHTGSWPHEGVDLTGKRVAVIGTGSSGIQLIPEIAKQAAHVTVLQRTPNFTVPARNASLDHEEVVAFKAQAAEIRKQWRAGQIVGAGEKLVPGSRFRNDQPSAGLGETELRRAYDERWKSGGAYFVGAFGDIMTDINANNAAVAFVHERIRELVKDAATADRLMPKDYPIGAKRICVDTDYYATFNRENVTLIDLKEDPIERVSENGLVLHSGERTFDALVFATGFDAMIGALMKMDIRGRGGERLADAWAAGPVTYLGLMVHGFPDLFLITGPGSPSVLGNVVCHIEQHVDFVANMLVDGRQRGLGHVEADAAAQEQWVKTVYDAAAATLFMQANSWYLGANVPGRPRVFMPFVGGIGVYKQICDDVAANGYRGFNRRAKGAPLPGASEPRQQRQTAGAYQ
jgi:cyclohexanone monooxygenase